MELVLMYNTFAKFGPYSKPKAEELSVDVTILAELKSVLN